jgi:hypothetical protein
MYTTESESLRGDSPRINNYKSFNISPMKTKFDPTDQEPTCLVHAVLTSTATPSAHLRRWNIVSACAFRWRETDFYIVCSPVTSTSTEVSTRKAAFPSVNHWMTYNYIFVPSFEWITLYKIHLCWYGWYHFSKRADLLAVKYTFLIPQGNLDTRLMSVRTPDPSLTTTETTDGFCEILY